MGALSPPPSPQGSRPLASTAVFLLPVLVGVARAVSVFHLAIGLEPPSPSSSPPSYCPLGTSTQIAAPSPGPSGNTSAGAPSSIADGSVVFTASASGCVPPYSFGYVFGDGTSSDQANVTHVYPGPGYYSGSLTIRDSTGHSVESYFCIDGSNWPNLTIGSGNPAPACP